MGGCASKPKEFGGSAAPISSESSARSNAKGGESQIENPAVDGSEPKKEAETSSSEAVSAETDVATIVKPTEDEVVKAAAENAEDKAEATTKPPVKEAEEPEHRSNDALPGKEEVKCVDAPLVSL